MYVGTECFEDTKEYLIQCRRPVSEKVMPEVSIDRWVGVSQGKNVFLTEQTAQAKQARECNDVWEELQYIGITRV